VHSINTDFCGEEEGKLLLARMNAQACIYLFTPRFREESMTELVRKEAA
jgi:hypothetical protein